MDIGNLGTHSALEEMNKQRTGREADFTEAVLFAGPTVFCLRIQSTLQ
jgi:hypothetical protein